MNENENGVLAWVLQHKVALSIAVAVVAIVLVVLGVLNWQRAVRAEGYEWQNNSLAKYQGVQTTLST